MPEQSDFIWLFFKTSGRVSRAAYFLGGLLVALIQAFPLYRFTLVPEGSAESNLWSFVFFLAFLGSLWSNIVLAVKRLHDLDKPGIAALVLFVPVVSIAVLVGCRVDRCLPGAVPVSWTVRVQSLRQPYQRAG